MKDTYRERIKEEQKKLSPQQFFFQKAISGFSSILQMKWQGKAGAAAFVPEYRRRTGRLE